MLHNSSCNLLCRTTIPFSTDGTADGKFINERIFEGYLMNWLIDGLPAARSRIDTQTDEKFYSVGFELGSLDNVGTPLLNNHYDIVVEFHVHSSSLVEVTVDCGERSVSCCGISCSTFK
jgi:transmembrane 9 superfamily member 2/4